MIPGSRRLAPVLILLGSGIGVVGAWLGEPDVLALALGLGCGLLALRQGQAYFHSGGESDWLLMCLFFFLGWPLAQLAANPEATTRIEQAAITLQYFGSLTAAWGLAAWIWVKPVDGAG